MSNLWESASNYTNGIRILRDWVGEGGIVVSPELAQSRANICLKCPENVKSGKLATAIANGIKEHIEFKNQLELRVQGEKQLHTCQVCSCVLKLKVHVPIDYIRKHPTAVGKFPDHCWQLNEL